MTKAISHVSLQDTVMKNVGDFLWAENFTKNLDLQGGIVEIINLISDYHEEGSPLQPHVIITNDLKVFDPIPHKEIVIKSAPLSLHEFKEVIKLCAPLAIDNWVIFIEVNGTDIKYGIISSEMTETSLSIYLQTVGELQVNDGKYAIAYLRKVGNKTVELTGLNKAVLISLTLDNSPTGTFKEVYDLSKQVSSKCSEKYASLISTFFEKIINEALRLGHGNLIGIVNDDANTIDQLKNTEKKCVYLPTPIDFQTLFIEAESTKTNEASINLISYASVLRSMLNHDGITILTNTGKLIGYHLLIGDYINPEDKLGGGTRSKAFQSMVNCNHFECCFFKSQDGNTKIYTKK